MFPTTFTIGGLSSGQGPSFGGLPMEGWGFAVGGAVSLPDGADQFLPPAIANTSPAAPLASSIWTRLTPSISGLWDNQVDIVRGVTSGFVAGDYPWLGIASPMQTGKSYATVPIINRIGGSFERVIVLCDSKAAYAERRDALFDEYGEDNVGQYNGKVKNLKHTNIAMMQTLVNHLDQLSPDKKTLILLDEAITTQRDTVRKILHHLGLGTVNTNTAARAKGPLTDAQLSRGKFIPPEKSKHLLVGLSGTGGGLDGYHVVSRYDMLDAIQDARVRHLIGDQVYLGSASTYRRSTDDPDQEEVEFVEKERIADTQIWWKATERNARILARVYLDRIYDNPDIAKKDMIFVPTIKHGELLLAELKKEFVEREHGDKDAADAYFGFVHSGGEVEVVQPDGSIKKVAVDRPDSVNNAEIAKWRADGGALISVGMLNKSFPATGAGGSFHTYQTTSDELFAQRTGRGWGNNSERDLPPLYVLEATWSRHQKFSNLAKLLGFVDYPTVRLNTRDLMHHIPEIRKRRKAEAEMTAAIETGTVAPMFQNVPLVLDWRTRFRFLAGSESHRIVEMARQSGIPEVYLQGFAQGGLPTRLAQIDAMAPFIGDVDAAIGSWVDDWRGVITDLTYGARVLTSGEAVGAVPDELVKWQEGADEYPDARAAATDLDTLLAPYFGLPLTGKEIGILQGAINTYADEMGWESRDIKNDLFTDDPPKRILASAMGSVMFGQIGEKQLSNLMSALILYFSNRLRASGVSAILADEYGSREAPLMEVFFDRRGWPAPENLFGELVDLTRQVLVRRYGENWPARIESELPVPSLAANTALYKCLVHNQMPTDAQIRKGQFFLNMGRLLYALWDGDASISLSYVHQAVEYALMEKLGWNDKGKTAGEKRRFEVRQLMAKAFLEPVPTGAARKDSGITRLSSGFTRWLNGEVPAVYDVSAKLSAEIERVSNAAVLFRLTDKGGADRLHRAEPKAKKTEVWRRTLVPAMKEAFGQLGLLDKDTVTWGTIDALRDVSIEGEVQGIFDETGVKFHLDSEQVAEFKWDEASKPACLNLAVDVVRCLLQTLNKIPESKNWREVERALHRMAAVIAEMKGWPIAREIRRALDSSEVPPRGPLKYKDEVRSDLDLRSSIITYLVASRGMDWPKEYFPRGSEVMKWLVGRPLDSKRSSKEQPYMSLHQRRLLQSFVNKMSANDLYVLMYDRKSGGVHSFDEEFWEYIFEAAEFNRSMRDRSDGEDLLLSGLRFQLVFEMGGGLDVNDHGYTGRPPRPDSDLIRWLKGERMPLTDELTADIRALIDMRKDSGERLYSDATTPREELTDNLEEWMKLERG